MSDYIIYDIKMDIEQKLDFDGKVEDGKPVRDYPNHYLGKAIGVKGDQLKLFRNRRGQVNESVPTWVLRNDNGIALIRIHNLERYSVYDMPIDENSEKVNKIDDLTQILILLTQLQVKVSKQSAEIVKSGIVDDINEITQLVKKL